MAFQDLTFGLVGDVPGLNYDRAKTFVNEALGKIYDKLIWSFQFKESNWLTPGLQFGTPNAFSSAGTISATAYNNQIIGDATASAAWAAYQTAGTLPLLTAFQIRQPYYGLYNIIAYDTTSNPPFGTFTLDRPWLEPTGTGLTYMVYQAYFPVPVSDFKRFLDFQDFTNGSPLDFWSYTRKDLAWIDPQRTNFNQPYNVVPYEVDSRVASPTLGYMLYELWPHPLSVLPYHFDYLRRGPLLVNPSDTVSSPLTDELVLWRAKRVAYQWKEAQKGDGVQRGAGADWRYLAAEANKEFDDEFKVIADRDRDLALTYFDRFIRNNTLLANGEPFATITGGLNVGR